MSQHKHRIRLLLEHRSRQLDEMVAELARRKQAASGAAASHERLEQLRERAVTERTRAATEGINAEDWGALNAWLTTVEAQLATAREARREADASVLTATADVLAARAAVKQVESLAARLAERERIDERRREQRAADEHTTVAFARRGDAR